MGQESSLTRLIIGVNWPSFILLDAPVSYSINGEVRTRTNLCRHRSSQVLNGWRLSWRRCGQERIYYRRDWTRWFLPVRVFAKSGIHCSWSHSSIIICSAVSLVIKPRCRFRLGPSHDDRTRWEPECRISDITAPSCSFTSSIPSIENQSTSAPPSSLWRYPRRI
jgi:hypothetical protein